MWFSVIAGSLLCESGLAGGARAHAVMRAHQMRQLITVRQGPALTIALFVDTADSSVRVEPDDWDALPKQLGLRIVRIKVEIQA